MQYRHEVKHEITQFDRRVLIHRLGAVMQSDPYAQNGVYEIRSLYFDTPDDRALREKTDGVNIREKYRIRLYNLDTSVIHLERKYKHGNLGYKETAALSPERAQAIARGEIDWMAHADNPVLLGFYTRMRNECLRARVIVEYTREPFVYAPGNVRVTIDSSLRAGYAVEDFLNPDCVTVPIPDAPCILEVKWDAYLPDVIRDAVQLPDRRGASFSKYAACRMFG